MNAATKRCILAATDGSDSASRAVEVGGRLSKQLAVDLLIVTVGKDHLSPAEVREAGHMGMPPGEVLEMLSQQTLTEARQLARHQGAAQVRVLQAVGDPSQMLLDIVGSEHVDMIVIGRRGRGRLAGLLLGSVSQKLASLAPCSVVVVP